MRSVRVYIAAPYSHPDPVLNTHLAMRMWYELWQLGFIPYCPHWTLVQHLFHPLPIDDWYEYDSYWLSQCDVVLRIPGLSKGADAETEQAFDREIPVVYDVGSLLKLFPHVHAD